MQILKKNGIILFWMILFADCYFLYEQKYDYHAYAKMMLLPLLMYYVFANARKKHFIRSKTLVFLGMLFAWVGDILLLQDGDTFFIWGMIAFMATHIFYSIFFYRVHPIAETQSYEVSIISLLIIAGIYYQLYKFLHSDLDLVPQFKIPVYVYGLVIGAMAVFAANIISNRGKRNLAVQYFIPGAILFMASDATLAIFKFKYVDVDFLQVIVMITYGYAQCLMAQGFTKYLKG